VGPKATARATRCTPCTRHGVTCGRQAQRDAWPLAGRCAVCVRHPSAAMRRTFEDTPCKVQPPRTVVGPGVGGRRSASNLIARRPAWGGQPGGSREGARREVGGRTRWLARRSASVRQRTPVRLRRQRPRIVISNGLLNARLAHGWAADAGLDGLELAAAPLSCRDSASPYGSVGVRWALDIRVAPESVGIEPTCGAAPLRLPLAAQPGARCL
jgi:hypothetical protein